MQQVFSACPAQAGVHVVLRGRALPVLVLALSAFTHSPDLRADTTTLDTVEVIGVRTVADGAGGISTLDTVYASAPDFGGGSRGLTTLDTVVVTAPRINDGGGGAFAQQRTAKEQETQTDCRNDKVSGNPVLLSTGSKIERELDFTSGGEMGLYLERTYNRHWSARGIFGRNWLSNFDYSLTPQTTASQRPIWVQVPDGRRLKFLYSAAQSRWNEDKPQPVAYVRREADGTFTHFNENKGKERYRADGYILERSNEQGIKWTFHYSGSYLQYVTHTSGRRVDFTWSGREVVAVEAPNSAIFTYTYTPNVFGSGYGRLASSTRPGSPAITTGYHYEDARFPDALTGKSIGGQRYSWFTYHADGRAASTEHAGGADRYSFTYAIEQTEQVAAPPAHIPPGGFGGGDHPGWCEYRPGDGEVCFNPLRDTIGKDAKLGATNDPTRPRPTRLRVTETNPLNHQSTYLFEDGKLVSVEGAASQNCAARYRESTYDANGFLNLATDYEDGIVDHDFDAGGRLLKKVEAVGTPESRTTTYTWDTTKNRVLTEKLLGVVERSFEYDTKGRVKKISAKNLSAHGVSGQIRTTTITYTEHPSGLVRFATHDGPLSGSGDAITYEFSALGDLISVKNALDHEQKFSDHNGLGLPTRSTGVNGAVTDYTYDARGQMTRQRDHVGSLLADTDYRYNAFGALRLLVQPDGHRRIMEYDAAHRLTSVSEALPQGEYAVRSYEYNDASLVTVERDEVLSYPKGTDVKGVIDGVYGDAGSGYLIRGWACSKWMDESIRVHLYAGGPAGSGTAVGSYLAGASSESAVAASCEAGGNAYRFNIAVTQEILDDHGGRTIHIHAIRPSGGPHPTITRSGTFSIPGGPSPPPPAPPLPPDLPECPWPQTCVPFITPPSDPPMTIMAATEPRTAYTDYDELGRVRARRGTNGQNVRYKYDHNGNLAQTIDSLNRPTDFIYDPLSRLSASIDAKDGTTLFEYDAGDKLVRVEDPRGKVTTYAYDGFGQPWSQTSPDTGTTGFTYNAAGQRTKLTRNDGSQLTYTYGDTLGRLTAIVGGSERREFGYDDCSNGLGQLCAIYLNQTGTTLAHSVFLYTRDGLLEARHDIGSGANDITRYKYDTMRRTTRITYPSGVHADYAYDRGRVASLQAVLPSGATYNIATGLEYEASGALSGWTYGNGIVRDHSYDTDGRRHGISSRYGSTMLQSLTLGYNKNDLVTAITDGTNASQTHQFQYDELGRLTSDKIAGTTTFIDEFDAVGNRTFRTRKDGSNTTFTQAYPIDPDSNRMLGMSGNANRNFFYNGRGHLESSTGWLGNRTYAYDAFDRLKSTTVDGTTTSYLVNALDQRVKKTGPLGTFRYVYAGQNTLLGEHTGAGLTGWKNYLYLDGQPVALVSGNNVRYFLHTDHLGRPELMTDGNRAAVWRGSNGSYSRSVTLGDPATIPLGFPGQIWDEETSTWYNGFRDYDPFTGRYLQSDPIGLAGGLNTYAYVGGNPVNHIDPSGLCEDKPKEDCMQAALNTYSMEESFNSIVGFGAGTALFGGTAQGLNKTAIKPRKGIAGGGPSRDYTSYSRRYMGDVGRTIGRTSIGAVMKIGGILGAGVGAMTEHAEAIEAFLECQQSQ